MENEAHIGHRERLSLKTEIEAMPDIRHQPAVLRRRPLPRIQHSSASAWARRFLLMLSLMVVAGTALGDSTEYRDKTSKKPNLNNYDIAVIIDNREHAADASAKEDVRALKTMMHSHMLADHIITLETPSHQVICDIFGGCPNEADQPWPTLLEQVVHKDLSKLIVYYLGPARVEGKKRQWLLRNEAGNPVDAYALGGLHRQLIETSPHSAIVLMDNSFAPRPLPCSSENPELIDATMETVKRNYRALMLGRGLPSRHAELSATLPVQAPHCDRFELTTDGAARPLFTKFVLKGIVDGLADQDPFGDEDGVVDLGELAAYTNDRIERAVQFQWGREQTVWQVGEPSLRLAKVEGRPPAEEIRPPKKKPKNPTPNCKLDPTPKGCHVCEQDPVGDACKEFCQANPDNSFYCASTCTGQEISEACPCVANDPRQGCRRDWCQWQSVELGPTVIPILEAVGIERKKTCDWITDQETEPNLFWQLFTPIVVRLLQPQIDQLIACTLGCRRSSATASGSTPAEISQSSEATLLVTEASEPVSFVAVSTSQEAPAEHPRSLEPRTALHKEICDDFEEPLPPYIALPRWMPGTLFISETLRKSWGCDIQVVVRAKTLKRDPYFAKALPPPVWTFPPRFGMPPPTSLPPPPRKQVAMPPPVPLKVPPPFSPFEPTLSQARWLQSALTIADFDPGPIDGVIGEQTNIALQRWRDFYMKGNVIGCLTKPEFDEIIRRYGESFDQIELNASLYAMSIKPNQQKPSPASDDPEKKCPSGGEQERGQGSPDA